MSIDHHQRFAGTMQRFAPLRALIERGLRRLLPNLDSGWLRILLPNGSCVAIGIDTSEPEVTLQVKSWRAVWRLVIAGEVGFARSYIDDDWSTGDLYRLFQLVMLNETSLSQATSPRWLVRALHRIQHHANRNTLKGSRSNISAHYDLGNAFYERWLDSGMNYSSALYRDREVSLETAQVAKRDRVIELLQPGPGERVLEIGCGWGDLAESLVKAGSSVTAVTLSPAQYSHVRQRLSEAIAVGRVDLKLLDYREITGRFDRIVSIEMIEAVGQAFWPVFFSTLSQRLRKGGTVVLQAITICETRFEAYRTRPDFIQRHIFPGGMLPTASIILEHAERAGLELVAHECFGESYARTLAEWRRRFHRAWPDLAREGFDDRFYRLWDYYLAYCETGFRFNATDVGLFKFEHRGDESDGLTHNDIT